ncbi:TonB-dependent receptor plug domain-containing protein [Terrimonas pollutisoli]|uniref:TonB-dependent receptor plug domain-containing protein n=1 Tax=Terrimonas pollutisoli TaxID=3034147 RepID=UPI0023ECFAA6|nr:TonB-dependent receptor [Terrimonas sp. H1YJ31]
MKRKLIVIASLFPAVIVSAQQADEKKDTAIRSLDEVVVTAQRHQQQSLLVPYSVSTMSQQSIAEKNSRTTPEALMGTNGVFVQKTNHGGGSLFVRGVTGNQTLILVDGIRLNNSTFRYGPNQYLNTIDPFTIKRIEVAKGTGSVQYGTDAIGGVVHVLTIDPQFATGKSALHGRVIGKYITDDMEKTIRGEAMYSGKKFALITGIVKKNFGDLRGGDTTGRQSPSGYDEWSLDMKAKILLKKNIQLTLANQFLQQKNVPVYHKIVLENFAVNEMDPQQRLLSYARMNMQGKSSFFKETEITFSYQQSIEGRNSRKNGSSSLRKERDEINTIGFTADVFSEFTKVWTANSGVELYYDNVGSTRQDINTQTGISASKRGLYPDDSRYGNYSLYSLHHVGFGKWIVDAGLRFNTFDIRVSDTTLGNVKISPSAWVGNAALMYQLTKNQTVYAAFSSGYRAPNVDDMGTLGIVDFRYELPTSDLKPERSQHTELGYKFQAKRLSGTVAAYYMHLTDLISRVKMDGQVIGGYQVYQKENTESAFIKGIETELNWNAIKNINITGGIAYAYGQSLSRNEPLRRIPPFNGRLMSTYRNNKWFAAAELQSASSQKRLAQGDKDDNRIPAGGTPGWKVFNLFGGYKFSIVQLNAGIQNIFNEDYRTHGSGINAVGRSAWLSVNFNF